MSNVICDHEDAWGAVLSRPESGMCEIRWFDTTSTMQGDDFNGFLSTFATAIEAHGATSALVDAVQFRMPMERMSMGWRDQHIVPRYNEAGLKRFAFIMPTGMPAIGAPPAVEGPADYLTAYFATRQDAIRWLMGTG